MKLLRVVTASGSIFATEEDATALLIAGERDRERVEVFDGDRLIASAPAPKWVRAEMLSRMAEHGHLAGQKS